MCFPKHTHMHRHKTLMASWAVGIAFPLNSLFSFCPNMPFMASFQKTVITDQRLTFPSPPGLLPSRKIMFIVAAQRLFNSHLPLFVTLLFPHWALGRTGYKRCLKPATFFLAMVPLPGLLFSSTAASVLGSGWDMICSGTHF